MLDREEYIEQAHFFRAFGERVTSGVAAQEALAAIGQEVLATTKLPLAIDYLVSELKLVGTISTALARLPHYFTAFQTFIMEAAEEEGGRFDMRTGLAVLARLAPVVTTVTDTALESGLEDLASAVPMVDWCAMRHETQYTRLFRS